MPSLIEFIEHHLMLGFDHIFLGIVIDWLVCYIFIIIIITNFILFIIIIIINLIIII
jgi:hypothetical protein